MAIKYIDGFAHYTNLTGAGNRIYEVASSLWSGPAGSSNPNNNDMNIADMPGITGAKALKIFWRYQSDGALGSRGSFALPESIVSGETWGFGFHAYFEDLPGGSGRGLFGFGTSPEVNIVLNNAGTLQYTKSIFLGGSPTGTPVGNLSPDTLYHIEVQIYFHASAGEVHVKVNGADWLEVTGVNTMPAVTNVLAIGPVSSNGTDSTFWYMSDLFIYKTATVDEGWIGEKYVETLLPSSDGTPQDWTLSGGSDAFDLINNVPSDPLNDYIESANVGDRSVFGLSDLADSNVGIFAIQTVIQAYKTGTADADVDFGVRSGSTDDLGNTGNLGQETPAHSYFVSEVDPATSAAWDASAVNALELVVERST